MIEVRHISKSFGTESVLRDIAFHLQQGHTLSVLGKSGCGKTTLLKILSGIHTPDAGTFTIDGQNMFALGPRERGVVYLSQEPLLFPHLTAFENIAFGLRVRKLPENQIQTQVKALLAELGLESQAQKYPAELSGGQRQRVSFGRAVIIQPRVLLLDEPFASLDVQTRAEMQGLYQKLRQQHRITALFVTHDLKEALIMGDDLGRMENGVLRTYPNRQAFLQDPQSGAGAEMDFWAKMRTEQDEQGL